jgi:hypothetical protein
MSWLFSRVLVEEFSEAICLDGELSALLSGNSTPQAFCAPDKMTGFSRLSQFGMTYKPLTESRGEALLTLYQEAFLAKIFHQRGGGAALMENAALCGEKWHGWLAKFDPATSLWKTAQCSLLEDSTECYQTFTNWGLMRDGELWAQTTLAHPIEGNDFGWLPTPVATDYMNGQVNGITYTGKRFVRKSKKTGTEFGAKLTSAYRLMTGNRLPANFSEWMMGWPQEWTELRPQGTGKFHKWQQQHGGY